MESSKLLIRQVAVEEASILQSISIETFVDTYGLANTRDDMNQYLAENFSIPKLEEELKDQQSKIFFALPDIGSIDIITTRESTGKVELNNEPIGYLKLNLHRKMPGTNDQTGLEIARIYVRKKFQGMQVGKLLFNTTIETAKKYMHNYIWLGVWEKNPNAIKFYEKMGFYHAGRHTFKLGQDIQLDVIMKLDL